MKAEARSSLENYLYRWAAAASLHRLASAALLPLARWRSSCVLPPPERQLMQKRAHVCTSRQRAAALRPLATMSSACACRLPTQIADEHACIFQPAPTVPASSPCRSQREALAGGQQRGLQDQRRRCRQG